MQSQSRWKLRTTCRHGPPPGATIATTQTKPGEPRKNQHSGTRRQRRWQSTTRRRRRTSELQTACLACYGLCVASHHCHHCVIVIVIVPHAEPWAIWVSIQLPDDVGDASAVHVLQCSSTVLEHCNTCCWEHLPSWWLLRTSHTANLLGDGWSTSNLCSIHAPEGKYHVDCVARVSF